VSGDKPLDRRPELGRLLGLDLPAPPADEQELARAYLRLFASQDGLAVLADLALMTMAHESTFAVDRDQRGDPVTMKVLEGRRQVWLRIRAMVERARAGVPAIEEDREET
jgi:hypothetical protein